MRHLPPWKIACHLSLQSFTANNVLKGFFYWLGNQLGFISAFFKALHWFASTFVQQYHENAKGVGFSCCSLHFQLLWMVVQIPSKKSRNYPRFTVTHKCCSTKNKPKIRWLLSWLGKVPRKALDIQIFPLPNFTTKLLFSMGNHGMRRSSFFLLLFYSLSRIEGGFL